MIQIDGTYYIYGFVLIIIVILWAGLSTKDKAVREGWFFGIFGGIILSVMAYITGKANEGRIDTKKHQAMVLKNFINGLKNLFIRR